MQSSLTKTNPKTRDFTLDVLKVFGCFLVVLLHAKGLVIGLDGSINNNNIMIESFCAPCVEIFFFTSGFYLYKESGSYHKTLLRLLFSVIIPFTIFCLIFLNFTDYLLGLKGLRDNFSNNDVKENIHNLYLAFRYGNSSSFPNTLNHLWYVFTYIEVIIFYPISKCFVQKVNKYVQYIVLAICFFFLIQNDYRLLTNSEWIYNIYFTLPKAIVITIFGHVIFNDFIKKDYLKNKKLWIIILSILSVVLMIVSYYLQKYFYEEGGGYYFNSWSSGITFVRTVILCVIAYLIDFKPNVVISYIATMTFDIYLIHYVILQRLLVRFVEENFRQKCHNALEDYAFAIGFTILVLVCTLPVCVLIKEVKKKIYKSIFLRPKKQKKLIIK